MKKVRMSKKIIGILIALVMCVGYLIMPLEGAFAELFTTTQEVKRGSYYDLPETVDNYVSSGKTLEFDLNVQIASTDVCKLGLYDGSDFVSSEFILRDGEDGISVVVEPMNDGWYHYCISLATVPHTDGQENSSITRFRARSTFPDGTLIRNITLGEDVRSLPEAFTEDYDTVTLADLGLLGTDYKTVVQSGTYEYEGKSATHSVIVKFGWKVNLTDTIDWKIALDTFWNANCMVWFRNNAIYFCPGQGEFNDLHIKTDPILDGTHDVEFGRLRVVAGPNYGLDYVFLKIDGEVIASQYTDHYQTEGGYIAYDSTTTTPSYTVHFVNDGVAAQGFSGFAKPEVGGDVYTKDYDTVTLADLGLAGTDYKTSVSSGSYSYKGKSKTHSVIVKFGWDPNITETTDWKIALDTYWNANCMVWFRDNAIYFCPGQGGFTGLYAKIDPIISGKREVEFGRLRVVDGRNKGKDHVFLKIDGEIVASKYTNHYQTEGGYIAYDSVTTTPSYTVHFINDGVAKQGFSGFAKPDKYVTDVDYINLGDVIPGGVAKDTINGNSLGYTYPVELSSATNSTVVKFVIKTDKFADAMMDGSVMVVDIGGNCGFCRSYISKGQKNSIMFGWEIEGCNSDSKRYQFESNSWYAVEQGRIRVASGINKGKDYVYLKINGELISSFYGEPDSRPLLGKQIYVEATEAIQIVGYHELRVKYYVGNELYLNQHAQKGFTARKPEDPEKSGQYFVGWYTQKTGGSLFNFKNTKITANLNLYARFTTETVQVTFNPANGDAPTVVTAGKNCLVPKPATPSYTDGKYEYVFAGWKNDKTGEIHDFETDRLKANTTFTATYKEKEYYVSYYAQGKLVKKVSFVLSNPTIKGKVPAVPKIPNTKGAWEQHSTSGLTKSITVNAVYTVNVPSSSKAVKLSKYSGDKIYLNTNKIHDYLTTETSEQTAFVREFWATSREYQDHQNTTFEWTDKGKNDKYTVYFADNKNFKNAFIVTTNKKSLINEVGIFVPGKTYYWFVCGNNTGKCSAVDSFKVVNTPVRYITAGKVINMRDLGGQVNKNGEKVGYGLIYRGAALDEHASHVNDEARKVFNYLGMNSEIELRGGIDHTYTGWDGCNPNVFYVQGVNYQEILEMGDEQKAQYVAMFEALADENNYPFYFHCSAGADRTGTLAFLLYALVGVSYDDIRPEYELTTFSPIGLRAADGYSGDLSMDGLYEQMLKEYGNGTKNLQLAVRNYLIDFVGVDGATLDAIVDILIDEDAEPNEQPHTITVKVQGKKYTYKAFEGIYFMPETPQVMGKIFRGFYNGKKKYDGYVKRDITLTAKFEDIEFEPYDTISLKDLGIEKKKYPNQTNTVCTYEKTVESGGRLLQFILQPIGNMNNGDGPQISFTNDWSQNSYARLWLQGNTISHVYYKGGMDSGPDISKMLTLEAGKNYEVQYAIRVMKNKGYEGKKVFEVTVNGELLVQYFDCQADLSGNIIYFHGGTDSAYLINKPVYKTVKFYNGNKLIATRKAERCGLLPKVSEPAPKNGLPFAGWYSEPTGGTLWDENVDLVYEDISLYAHFANVKVIKADVEGKIFTYRVEVGKTLDEIPKPLKPGHVFVGWLLDGEIFTGEVTTHMNVTAAFEEYSFDDYDEISLRDLGINGDLDVGTLGENNVAAYTYHKAASTGGRVFKATYIPTEGMINGPQVSFSERWDENYYAKLYFTKFDKLYVYSSGIDGGLPTLTMDTELVGGKKYNFEIGVRVLNNKGYKGVKVLTVYLNGELIFEEFDNRMNLENATVFFQGMPDTGIFKNVNIYKTVSFYDGEQKLSSVKVLRGERVKSYGDLKDKGDMLFQGWYTIFGIEWNFDLDGVYLDTDLKAKFLKQMYPVLLMVDNVMYKRINAFAGEPVEIFDVPTKEGYVFEKWLNEDGTEYDMQTVVNEPIKLHASFAEAPPSDDALQSGSGEGTVKPEAKPIDMKYIIFLIIGLAAIVAEVAIMFIKKGTKKS